MIRLKINYGVGENHCLLENLKMIRIGLVLFGIIIIIIIYFLLPS